MSTPTDVDVTAISQGDEDLPVFYRQGFTDFMAQAQRLDPENRHRWVHVSVKNQHLKVLKGWTPVEDREKLTRLGLTHLVTANGRARWMDLELWTMPRARAERIRRHISEETRKRSASTRAAVDAANAETTGRSKGTVKPFIESSGDGLSTNKQVSRPE
jgi:hypothetical protein